MPVCQSCGSSTSDYECGSCERFLGGKGITRLSDSRYQYTTGRKTYYIRRSHASEADKAAMDITADHYYIAEVDDDTIFGSTLTTLIERLRVL